jgi:hypothetical protein
MTSDAQLTAFAAYGLATQVILLVYFTARRWRPPMADRFGWIAYAFGTVGLVLGIWLVSFGASYRLFAGPLLYAAWAAYGAWVDLWQRTEWRQPIRWNIIGPYVILYLAAQMFLWWPLWDTLRPVWVIYLWLFIANTTLNISGHFGSRPKPAGHPPRVMRSK